MHNNAKASSETVTKSDNLDAAFLWEYFTFPTTEGRKYLCSKYKGCFFTMPKPTMECDLLLVKLSIGMGSSAFIIMSEKQAIDKPRGEGMQLSLSREIFINNELQLTLHLLFKPFVMHS